MKRPRNGYPRSLSQYKLALHRDLCTIERQQRVVNDRAKLVFTIRSETADMGCKRTGLCDRLCGRRRPGARSRVGVFTGIARYSNPTCSVELSPISSTSPRSVS